MFEKQKSFGLKFIVLKMLSNEEMTGSMMIERLNNISMGFWKPSPGSIYPVLEWLQTEGLVTFKAKEEKGSKKYYKITPKGKKLLEDSWVPWKNHKFDHSYEKGKIPLETIFLRMKFFTRYLNDNKDIIKKDKRYAQKLKEIVSSLEKIEKEA